MLVSVLFWHLQVLGRGHGVLHQTVGRVQGAYTSLAGASVALADYELEASQQGFVDAQSILKDARRELDEALAASDIAVDVLDVTGTVRSGDRLLATGQLIANAGEHLAAGMQVLTVIDPLAGEETGMSSITATLDEAISQLQQAQLALAEAEQNAQGIATVGLPADVRSYVHHVRDLLPRIRQPLLAFLDRADVLLSVLGSDREREYLLLFQNNHEIRPTGGFIGSIGVVRVHEGVVEDVDVSTVYDGDGQLKDFIAPPTPLEHITDRWYLRDSNWFADYRTSARKAAELFEKEGGSTVDGVIALTPDVIVRLLEVTGPIEVPEHGVTIDAESFVSVTQDLVTYSYDRELNRPKQFLADLTPLLLTRLFSGEPQEALAVLDALSDMIEQKHLLVYFADDEAQESINALGWSGALPEEAPGMLAVVNANIGGHKSDQFMAQEIDQRIVVDRRGHADVTLTIRRTHHGPAEDLALPYPPGENPAYKDNVVYQRVLVPPDAELVEARGFTPVRDVPHTIVEEEHDLVPDADVTAWQQGQQASHGGTSVGAESGYASFGNWIVTTPGATSVTLYRYRVPEYLTIPGLINTATSLGATVVKQPGDTRSDVRLEVHLPDTLQFEHILPEDGVTQTEHGSLVYRSPLRSDRRLGAVVVAR